MKKYFPSRGRAVVTLLAAEEVTPQGLFLPTPLPLNRRAIVESVGKPEYVPGTTNYMDPGFVAGDKVVLGFFVQPERLEGESYLIRFGDVVAREVEIEAERETTI